jgi:hypothetical protein
MTRPTTPPSAWSVSDTYRFAGQVVALLPRNRANALPNAQTKNWILRALADAGALSFCRLGRPTCLA